MIHCKINSINYYNRLDKRYIVCRKALRLCTKGFKQQRTKKKNNNNNIFFIYLFFIFFVEEKRKKVTQAEYFDSVIKDYIFQIMSFINYQEEPLGELSAIHVDLCQHWHVKNKLPSCMPLPYICRLEQQKPCPLISHIHEHKTY